MEVHHFRGWAEFADKATIIALTVAALAILAAGAMNWVSHTYNKRLDVHAGETHGWDAANAELEKKLALLRERSDQLDKALADSDERAAADRKQIAALERAVEATAARSAELDKQVAMMKAAAVERSRAQASKEEPNKVDGKHLQLVDSLQKFAGTKAAILSVDDAPDAAKVGSSINDLLTEAGWVSAKWKWAGVSGMTGILVLTKEGIDPSIDQAATATVGVMRSAGFNAIKASWPIDADWRRFRGTLSGPDSPAPTEAPIRIVIGARATVQH